MQKKVLLSSILVIALCLSAIAGSTYALFTDKAETSIAITSGDVEVTATMKLGKIYSAVANDTKINDYLVDEYGQFYKHVEQDAGVFLNKGTAAVEDGKLVVTNITPGDKFDAQIEITNKGNVDMVYRYRIDTDDKLAEAMVITTNDINNGKQSVHGGVTSHTSEWATAVVAPGQTVYVNLSFELPVYVGNEYQSEVAEGKIMKLTYDIVVEAVQGNANTNGLVELR